MKILQTESAGRNAVIDSLSKLSISDEATIRDLGLRVEEAAHFDEALKEDGLHPELASSYYSLKSTAIRRGNLIARKLIARAEATIAAANRALEFLNDLEGATPVNESVLKEGNPVSGELPPRVDAWLQDVAQMTNKITYNDIMKIRYTDENNKKLRHWHKKWKIAADEDNQDEMNHIGELVKKLVR